MMDIRLPIVGVLLELFLSFSSVKGISYCIILGHVII